MKNRRTIVVIAVAAAIALVAWYLLRQREPPAAIDLIATYDSAEKRPVGRPMDEVFAIEDVTINGETRRAILAIPPSRIIWKITVPQDAWLRLWLGIKPEVWDKEGNGALFRVGVSDGRRYDELLHHHVNPMSSPDDRRWIPVNIDLAAFSGLELDLLFNTEEGPKDQPKDARNDLVVWGAPQIFAGR